MTESDIQIMSSVFLVTFHCYDRHPTKATYWGLPVSESELVAITGSVAAAGRHGAGAEFATTITGQRELPGTSVGL